MNYRELLEAAAKASGIWNDTDPFNGLLKQNGQYWNPIEDDGDALRLAVKLAITDLALVVGRYVCSEKHRDGDDIYAITRRAIVRAAAEIGKGMP